MNVIVCLDDRDGMTFNHRRQSRDRFVYKHIAEHSAGLVYMNTYSAPLFSDYPDRICVIDDFLQLCGREDWCFLENADITPWLPQVEKLVVYRWNRVYPSDIRFPVTAFGVGTIAEEFAGHSHEKITVEVYVP